MIEQNPIASAAADADTLVVSIDPDTAALQLQPTAVDTLREEAGAIHYRELSPSEFFGATSQQSSMPLAHEAAVDPIATGGFSLLVLVLVGLYALLIYRHPADIRQLLQRLTQDRSTDDRLYDDSGSSFARFLNVCNLLGVGLIAAAVVRLASGWIPAAHLALLPQSAAALWSLALLVLLLVVILYRALVALAVGALTFTQPLFGRLHLIKRSTMALFTVMATPPMALWLLGRPDRGVLWFVVILIELVVSLILYLHETRQLFLSKKISVLHWILYLCGVEILPLSFLCLMAVRLA